MDPKHPLTPVVQESDDKLTRGDLERIANPMSVIFGYTQLLQRKIRRGETVVDEELLRVLGLMEQAIRTMVTGLSDVSRKTGSNGEHGGPED